MSKLITIGDAAKFLGCSVDTLRRWDKNGRLLSLRKGKSAHRYYSIEKIENFSKTLDCLKIAKEWVGEKEAFEPLSCYYCSDSFVFQSRLSRFTKNLIEKEGSVDFCSIILAIAGEIGNNSFDHNLGNWPDISGIFFCHSQESRKIVLADRGQGILKTLKRVRPGLKNHKQALGVAFTEVISGRSPEHRGNGLKFVRKMVAGNGITLFFQTGNAQLYIGRNPELKIKKVKRKIKGCLCEINFGL